MAGDDQGLFTRETIDDLQDQVVRLTGQLARVSQRSRRQRGELKAARAEIARLSGELERARCVAAES